MGAPADGYTEGARSMNSFRASSRRGLSGELRARLPIVESTSWQFRHTGSGVRSPQYRQRISSSMGEPHTEHAASSGVNAPHQEHVTSAPMSSAACLLISAGSGISLGSPTYNDRVFQGPL